MTRPLPRSRALLLAAVSAIVAVSCTTPEVQEPAPTTDVEDDVTAETLDPARDALLAALAEVETTVDEARAELDAAATADTAATARSSADAALELLLDDPAPGASSGSALFPAVSTERSASGDQDDQLAGLLSLAREAGGSFGRDVVETLRDPIAGDLGAWERDAEGVIADMEAAVAGITDLETGAEALDAFQGEGTRAVAWTLLATTTSDADLTRDAAERADGHLGIVTVALDLLGEQAAGSAPDDTDDGSGSDEPDTDELPAPEGDVPDDLVPDDLPDPEPDPEQEAA